jgi:DNA helicase-2/ATP-dependent DNA helicase PcrA
MDMSSFIKNLLEITGINSVYSEESEENINRRFNIDEFVSSFIKYFEDNPGSGLEEYLTSVTLISDIDNMDDKGISVATIHSAKGLEFRVVFICGLDDGIFPVKRAYNEQEDWEEERRLMYVAITRAKEKLFFTRAKSRYLYGERKSTRPSEFFSEIFPEESSGTAFRCGNFQGAFSGGNYIKNAPYSSPAKSGTDKRESACGDVNQYKEGSRIYHRIFGEGTIVSINGKGDSAIADIAFPKIGIKTFTLKFTPIKLI